MVDGSASCLSDRSRRYQDIAIPYDREWQLRARALGRQAAWRLLMDGAASTVQRIRKTSDRRRAIS